MGMTPLESLAKVVKSPKESTALRAIIAANPVTISFDPNCPNRGSKPEPPKIPSADQRGLSRARSMG